MNLERYLFNLSKLIFSLKELLFILNSLKAEITRSFRSFINNYKPKEAKVINLGLNTNKNIGNTDIKFVPYYKEITNK